MFGTGPVSQLELKQQKYPAAQQMFYGVLILRAWEMTGEKCRYPQKCEVSCNWVWVTHYFAKQLIEVALCLSMIFFSFIPLSLCHSQSVGHPLLGDVLVQCFETFMLWLGWSLTWFDCIWSTLVGNWFCSIVWWKNFPFSFQCHGSFKKKDLSQNVPCPSCRICKHNLWLGEMFSLAAAWG